MACGPDLRALELLALGPRSAPELADGLGVHVRTARRILRRLEGEGYAALGSGRRQRIGRRCGSLLWRARWSSAPT
jgi:DNA-binding IclR family transcriptional regulator